MNNPRAQAKPGGVVAKAVRHAIIAIAAATLAATSPASGGQAESAPAAAPDRDAVRKIVKEYLLEHPEIIEDAIRVLQARRESQERDRVQASLHQHGEALRAHPRLILCKLL